MSFRSAFIFLFLPLAVLVLYSIPAFLSSVYYDDTTALIVFASSIISIIVCIGIAALTKATLSGVYADFSQRRMLKLAKYIAIIFFLSYLVLAIDFGGFPVTTYFLEGGHPSFLRSDFTKEKQGLANIAIYIRSITLKGMLPIAVLIFAELRQDKWLKWSLALFSLIAVLTFEKAIILWLGGPLIIYFVFKKDWAKSFRYLIWSISVLLVSGGLQVGSTAAALSEYNQYDHLTYPGQDPQQAVQVSFTRNPSANMAPTQVPTSLITIGSASAQERVWLATLQQTPDYRFLLESDSESSSIILSTLQKILNRALWIPFITAYDALIFWNYEHGERLMLFTVNRHLSRLLGVEFSDIERELYRFQFGGNYDSTGNANFVFFIEGYVAFGLVGVFMYSLLVGLMLGLIGSTGSNAIIASGFAPIFSFLNASLLSSLFSGGVMFFFLLVIFGPKWRHK